jgi:hypothetical protein
MYSVAGKSAMLNQMQATFLGAASSVHNKTAQTARHTDAHATLYSMDCKALKTRNLSFFS